MPIIETKTREEWLAERRKRIGGSEIAGLFGLQAAYQQSHYSLWCIKSGRIPEPDVSNERTSWGLRLEEAIAAACEERYGWNVHKGGYVAHPTVEGAGCTLDYIIRGEAAELGEMRPEYGNGDGALELKNVDWMIHRQQWDGEPPIHIQLQLQMQLACTGYEWGAVVALIGGNELSEPYFFPRRPTIIAEIERKVIAFWQSVEAAREPPVDGSDATAAAIKTLFPHATRPDPADLTQDNELPDLCARYQQAASIRRQAEKDEQAAKNGILAKVGPHAEAICAGYRIKAAEVAGQPDKMVTPEMVGTVIKGRSGYRKLTLKEVA